MQSYMKIIGLGLMVLLVTSCSKVNRSLDDSFESTANAEQKNDSASIKQFQDANPEGPTAVKSALELSQKYAVLSEELAKLKMEKQDLEKENTELKQQAEISEKELTQAQKELSEANDLLIEMRIELNNWKEDVLGFRDEMRKADKAQLEALVKILKVLGGQVETEISTEPSQ